MIRIVKNKYINAILILMLFSAILHMGILFFLAIVKKNFYILNYFNILDLDMLFPFLFFDNFLSNVSSIIVVALIYVLILKIDKKDINAN